MGVVDEVGEVDEVDEVDVVDVVDVVGVVGVVSAVVGGATPSRSCSATRTTLQSSADSRGGMYSLRSFFGTTGVVAVVVVAVFVAVVEAAVVVVSFLVSTVLHTPLPSTNNNC